MRFSSRSLILGAAACAVLACHSSPTGPGAVTAIRATTAFGFCLGYCQATLEISSQEMVYIEESRSGLPTVRRTARLSSSEWNALIDGLDRGAIERLPETVGCPDCADGGAESIEVIGVDWRKRVTFEHGATMPELQPLLARVRMLRSRFPPSR